MTGVGPYIASPETALGKGLIDVPDVGTKQVPATELMAYKAIALARFSAPASKYSEHHSSSDY